MNTALTRKTLVLLVLLTLVWGFNWPAMKVGVSGLPGDPQSFPPLTFRAVSLGLGLPVLWVVLRLMRVPLQCPRSEWAEVLKLALPNMILWHAVVIVAVQSLSSGRAAILAYTMPVFSMMWGVMYGDRPTLRQLMGVVAAGLGVALLLSHEVSRLTGAPAAALTMLTAAALWALGTHWLRRSTTQMPLLALVLWMSILTWVVMTSLAVMLERDRWTAIPAHVMYAMVYNALGVFAFAHAAWFYLARHLPPVASSISVMLIPVLGTFSGAVLLGEALHWQDYAAVSLMVVAIAAVLLRGAPQEAPKDPQTPDR